MTSESDRGPNLTNVKLFNLISIFFYYLKIINYYFSLDVKLLLKKYLWYDQIVTKDLVFKEAFYLISEVFIPIEVVFEN